MIIKILLILFVLQLLKVLKTNKNMKITSPQLRRPPNKTAQTLKTQENAPLRQKTQQHVIGRISKNQPSISGSKNAPSMNKKYYVHTPNTYATIIQKQD